MELSDILIDAQDELLANNQIQWHTVIIGVEKKIMIQLY